MTNALSKGLHCLTYSVYMLRIKQKLLSKNKK